MREEEFLKLYKKNRDLKNKEEAKEKINIFWMALLEALEKEKKVIFKGWGVFEKKEIKSRKVLLPRNNRIIYTEPKSVIKFKAGKDLKESVNPKEVSAHEQKRVHKII